MIHTAYSASQTKVCPSCFIPRSLTEFNKGSTYCRPCEQEKQREWYAKNKERRNERSRKRYAAKKQEPATQTEMFPRKKSGSKCTCGNVKRCSECRRRMQAQESGDVTDKNHAPEYLFKLLPSDVLAACLEVRALNTSRRHAAGD